MKPQTKTVIVIATTISGRRNFIAGAVSRHETTDKYIVNYTTNIKDEAKEFDSIDAAWNFIPLVHNPCDRVFEPAEETITFHNTKERRAYEKIQ